MILYRSQSFLTIIYFFNGPLTMRNDYRYRCCSSLQVKRICVVTVISCATVLNFLGFSLSGHHRFTQTMGSAINMDAIPFNELYFRSFEPPPVPIFHAIQEVILPERHILTKKRKARILAPNYGGLELDFPAARQIIHESSDTSSAVLHAENNWDDEDCSQPGHCLIRLLNCNLFHELDLMTTTGDNSISQKYHAKWLGEGRYREAFELRLPLPRNSTEKMVWKKHLEKEHDVTGHLINMVRLEAEVMSAVTASPNTLDIYGYCHVNVFVEHTGFGEKATSLAYRGGRERKKLIRGSLKPKPRVENPWRLNNLTLRETVHYSLQAVLGVKDLHASSYVHEDLKLDQFMVVESGKRIRLKLNDFNVARRFRRDPLTHETIPFRGRAMPDYCYAPEYCNGWDRDETFDIFVLGGILFNFLAGEHVPKFWQGRNYTRGDYPMFELRHTLHPAEQEFVEIMYGCWASRRRDRTSAVDLVKRLAQLLKRLDRVGIDV